MTGTFRGMFHNRKSLGWNPASSSEEGGAPKSPSPMTCRMVARAPGLFDASNPSHPPGGQQRLSQHTR